MSNDAKLALDSWEALLSAHRELMRIFSDREHLWEPVSMREYDVLYTLAKAEEPLRLCDLSQGVLLSQPALSRMVDRLEERQLIHREPDPEDGRAVRISLTEEGAELQRTIGWSHGRDILREINARLTEEEQRDLLRICAKLTESDTDEE